MARKLSAFVFILFLILAFPVSVSANAAEPPGMIIIVDDAPDNIELTLELAEEPEYEVRTRQTKKNWEVYFRLYYPHEPGILNGAVIRVESSEKVFTCPIPTDAKSRYNNLLTLSYEDETLTTGQRWWRQPVLTAVRITLTLLVESLVFFFLGFRSKRGWVVFLLVNVVTQGWLNYIINSSAFSSGYWLIGLYLAEFVIFIAEAIVFLLAVKEKKKWQRLLYAVIANAASLTVGILLINHLPI
mgnify:CR=1 FL=1